MQKRASPWSYIIAKRAEEHGVQKMWPQARKWCLRRVSQTFFLQSGFSHCAMSLSATHCASVAIAPTL